MDGSNQAERQQQPVVGEGRAGGRGALAGHRRLLLDHDFGDAVIEGQLVQGDDVDVLDHLAAPAAVAAVAVAHHRHRPGDEAEAVTAHADAAFQAGVEGHENQEAFSLFLVVGCTSSTRSPSAFAHLIRDCAVGWR